MKRAYAVVLCLAVVVSMAGQVIGAEAHGRELPPARRVPMTADVARQLARTPHDLSSLVMLTGASTREASIAANAAGLAVIEELHRIGVVAAAGPADAVRAVHSQPGILRVDADPQLAFLDDVSHGATGIAQLREFASHPDLGSLRPSNRTSYDGRGVSIAVVDSGFDTTHEHFVKDGKSKFDVHMRQGCAVHREVILYAAGADPLPACSLWLPVPPNDDGPPTSGHGTIVAATAAGHPLTTPTGARVSGTAPGARLVGLSLGSGDFVYNATSALHWVLEHHADPCGDASCPPIRVVNNSYGLASEIGPIARTFDPGSPIGRVTTELVRAGVVVVFAAGNDGGDGSTTQTNFLALNPTPGFLSAAAFWDGNSGDRDATIAEFSSKGRKGDRSTYPDIAAPGASYLIGCSPGTVGCEITPGDGKAYGNFNGTSISAPYISGVVAQLIEADPSVTPAEIEDILEDTAHQGFVPRTLLEPDIYKDVSGARTGNADHRTSFHAGHGLVDVVGALSRVRTAGRRASPGVCSARRTDLRVDDPAGDAALTDRGSASQPWRDIVAVRASSRAKQGALTVVVRYVDLPEVEPQMHTTVTVLIDGVLAEVDLDRSLAGDAFSVFDGPVAVEGRVDPAADTATFVVKPTRGQIRERASVFWAWTANSGSLVVADVDFTNGTCPVWVQPSRRRV